MALAERMAAICLDHHPDIYRDMVKAIQSGTDKNELKKMARMNMGPHPLTSMICYTIDYIAAQKEAPHDSLADLRTRNQ